ncbi:hypothetical protein EC991_009986 [Linnemannia zychae]|nr:hypothetical protein EC991_009986 [Linnemannia zychae]
MDNQRISNNMTTSKQKKSYSNSRPPTPSGARSGTAPLMGSPFFRFEQAFKKLFRPAVQAEDRTVSNVLAAVPFGSIAMVVSQGRQDNDIPTSVNSTTKDLSISTSVPSYTCSTAVTSGTKAALSTPSTAPHPWLCIFPQNIAAPSPLAVLPSHGSRIETTTQLAYCNYLLRTQLSPSSAALSVTPCMNPSQKASVDAILQNPEGQSHIYWLTTRIVEEFVADSFKTSEKIAEVILLGPYLSREYHRKLLNCLVGEFESAKLLDIELLQGIIKLVQCAGSEYLLPDDLVRILVVLRTRLQDTHQQSTKHPYYLTLALSRLLDIMVEGEVQDLRCVVDQEPLLMLLRQLSSSEDIFLKHQAAYALQALLHIPNDETRREFMLRQAGRITMGLLGVASVCKLDLGEFKDGVDHLYKVAGEVHEVATKIVSGTQSLLESGQEIATSVKGGILSGGRQLWYSALREAHEHIRNGRLADFNRLVFEAPCHRYIGFQWGICRLLGEIAVDTNWDIATRQQAIDLLVELYKDESGWTTNNGIHSWILHLIRQAVALPESSISDYTQLIIQGLDKEGDAAKHNLYRDSLATLLDSYALQAPLQLPASSVLLMQVQATPDVEYDIHRMRIQRLKEREHALYIPPQAKPSLQGSSDILFPLMGYALDFLSSSRQVLLLLGDSGGGKSTFNLQLEHTLWQDYKRGDAIPLHISLPTIDKPQDDMIEKQLQRLHLFTEAQIQELRQNREFIVICDGYDESQLKENLYTTNQLNRPGQWKAKMIISCRSQYLGSDYRFQFQPMVDRYAQVIPDLFQEVVLAPFSRAQIEQYVEQYVHRELPQPTSHYQQTREVADLMDKLDKIPHLIKMVSNPFLLTLALRSLPRVVRTEQDLSDIRLTRVELYDSFTEEWLENNKCRLAGSKLSSKARLTFDMLLEEGFVQLGISYQKDLAAAIFEYQNGNPVVEYSPLRERLTWKASFFSPHRHITILREASPLTRSGKQFQFIHRSILEYLYSRVISDPIDGEQIAADGVSDNEEVRDSFLNHPLNQRSITGEPSILQFLAERVKLDPMFKRRLFAAIEASKKDATVSTAAANAISILVKAGVRFNGSDLRGIRIPGADLRGGEFDSADLEGADLSGVNLSKAWLRQSNLSNTQVLRVDFGELPYIEDLWPVESIVFSFDGEYLAVSCSVCTIHIFNTTTWKEIASYPGGEAIARSPVSLELAKAGRDFAAEVGDIFTGEPRLMLNGHDGRISCICYSSDGAQIATGSEDRTVRIWSAVSGDILHVLDPHSSSVTCLTFSPNGGRLVSCGEDEVVQMWDMETGEPVAELRGHNNVIRCVAYSPNGRQIAAGDEGREGWLWDVLTMKAINVMNFDFKMLISVAYSPDSNHIAFGTIEGAINLFDSHSGKLLSTLSGHTGSVTSVAYSKSGDYIASGSSDGYVRLWRTSGVLSDAFSIGDDSNWRCITISKNGEQCATGGMYGELQLWDTLTGEPGAVLKGHANGIGGLAFSPCGKRIASSCSDGTVRQWCVQTGATLHVFDNRAVPNLAVAFSPCGNHIAAASKDNTVQFWNALTGEPGHVLEGHTDHICNVVYSPSGRQIATSSADRTVRLWNAETGEQLFTLEHPKVVEHVMYSPDGKELLSISDCKGYWWDPQSGRHLDLNGIDDDIGCCCYSPNGNHIAVISTDEYLKLWDRSTDDFAEVFRAKIGFVIEVQWKQGSQYMYLITDDLDHKRVWQLMADDGTFQLKLLWSLGNKELFLLDANLCGAIGLRSSPVDLKLVEQRGATINSESDSPVKEE